MPSSTRNPGSRGRNQATSPQTGDVLLPVHGERLREARKRAAFSQGMLARKVGVTDAFISQLETGARTRCGTNLLTDIARKVAVLPEYLTGDVREFPVTIDLPGGSWQMRLYGDPEGRGFISLMDPAASKPSRGKKTQSHRPPNRYGIEISLFLQSWLVLQKWRWLLLGSSKDVSAPYTGTEQERFAGHMAEALKIIMAPFKPSEPVSYGAMEHGTRSLTSLMEEARVRGVADSANAG